MVILTNLFHSIYILLLSSWIFIPCCLLCTYAVNYFYSSNLLIQVVMGLLIALSIFESIYYFGLIGRWGGVGFGVTMHHTMEFLVWGPNCGLGFLAILFWICTVLSIALIVLSFSSVISASFAPVTENLPFLALHSH